MTTHNPALTRLAAAIAVFLTVCASLIASPPAALATSSVSGVVNSYQKVSAVSGSTVTVTGAVTGAGTAFAVGDKVMLIQMTGAPPAPSGSDFGNYDVATITAISSSTITLSAITRSYSPATEAVQLVRLYSDTGTTTVSGTVTAKAWDGVTGGVVAMSGQTLSLSANIDVSGKGFTNDNPPTTIKSPLPTEGQGSTTGRGYPGESINPNAISEGGGGTGGGGGINTGDPNANGGKGGSLGSSGTGYSYSGSFGPQAGTDGGSACDLDNYAGAAGGAGGGGGITGGGGGGGGGTKYLLSQATINGGFGLGGGGGGGGIAGGGAGGAGQADSAETPALACTGKDVPFAGGGGGGTGAPGNGADGLYGGLSGNDPNSSGNEGSAGGGGGSYGGGGGAASNLSGGDDSSGGGGGGSWTGGGQGGAGGAGDAADGSLAGQAGGDGNAAVGTQIPDSAHYLNPTNPRLMMGGAGGRGSAEAGFTDGGAGGGIVYADFTTITGGGQIISDGGDGRSPAGGGAHSGSGAGAGGQMRIRAVTITAPLVLAVNGGVGGTPTTNAYHAGVSGGGGGAGGIWLELAGATESCPAGPVPNVTFLTAGGEAGESITNPKNQLATGRAGDGATGLACVSPLAAPAISFEKTLKSSTPNGDGSYDVVYEITVTNSGDAVGTYDLSDTLRPGAGAVFESGSWTGPGTLSGSFTAANTATTFVTGRSLTNVAPGNVETYTVKATYTIDNSAVVATATDNSTDCTVTAGEPSQNTGFNNVASLTTAGTTTTDAACAPFGTISFEKTLKSSTLNPDGSYDVVYDIVVTNTSGATGAPAAYDLYDTLRPGAGAVFVSGSWTGPTSGTFAGPDTVTVVANDRLLTNVAPGNVETYTVKATYTIDNSAIVDTAADNSTDCVITAGEPDGNTGFHNVASLVTGGQSTDDDACAPLAPKPVPSVTIVKGDSDGHAADTAGDAVSLPDGTATLVYTITNDGTEDLKDVRVTDTVVSNGTVTGLTCDFSPLGGPSTGTTWAGPFTVGDSFECTAELKDVQPGSDHQDVGHVTGTGVASGTEVKDDDPYFGNTPPKPVPSVTIVKGDSDGHAADTAGDAVSLPDGTATLVYTITNDGTEDLKDVTVTDTVVSNGTVTGLTCDFSPLGGPSTGTTWAGPFTVGDSFECTAELKDVQPGSDHQDVGHVTGTGVASGTEVKDDDPYFGNTPPTTPTSTPTTTTPTSTPTTTTPTSTPTTTTPTTSTPTTTTPTTSTPTTTTPTTSTPTTSTPTTSTPTTSTPTTTTPTTSTPTTSTPTTSTPTTSTPTTSTPTTSASTTRPTTSSAAPATTAPEPSEPWSGAQESTYSGLAFTGSNVGGSVGLAVILLSAGVGLFALRRRLRRGAH